VPIRNACETCTDFVFSNLQWLARSGVLEGKRATTNRVMLDVASKMFPGTEWVDRRWVVDRACTNYDVGIDMFIEYTYQNFDKKMVEFGCVGLDFDYEGRSEFYKGKLPDMTMS
jgi:hypothetical protein